MPSIPSAIFENGPKIFCRDLYNDSRGGFEMIIEMEKIRQDFPDIPDLQQVNAIHGVAKALRGFHASQIVDNHWKLVTCIRGSVRDAMLDLRFNSPTFGQVQIVEMDAGEGIMAVIPPGFGHAVQSLSGDSITIYATNIPYVRNREFSINPLSEPWISYWDEGAVISQRDIESPSWEFFMSTGQYS